MRSARSLRRIRASPNGGLGGFTLIEILVVVAIVGVLASIALPFAELQVRRSKETDLRIALRTIRGAIDSYKQASDAGLIVRAPDSSGYPPSLSSLVEGVEVQDAGAAAAGAASASASAAAPPGLASTSGATHRKLYFLRSLPRDPFASKVLPADQTWALRSYDSPPDDPRDGGDVFDVHSTSDLRAIDATPYRSW